MSFDWKELLLLAHELAAQPKSALAGNEARIRAAIGRAYYSAFCYARAYVESTTGIPYRSSGSHTEVQNAYSGMRSRTARKIAADLFRLHEDRKKADYDDFVPSLNSVGSLALVTANDIITGVDSLI